jgi:DNA polymerase-4
LGITTVGEVAHLAETTLVSMLGRASGRHLHALAHNRDPRPVQKRRRRRSMGAQRALGRRPISKEALDATMVALADRLARRLRAARRVCRTVVLRLRFDDFSRATRSHTLLEATARTEAILVTTRGLLKTAMPMIERRGLTLVGITLTNLAQDGQVQLALPLDHPRATAVDAAVDDVRDRFGSGALTRAVLVGRDPGISVPLLPD